MEPTHSGFEASPAEAGAAEIASWTATGPRRARTAVIGAPFDGTSGGRPQQAAAPGLLRAALGLTQATGESQGLPVWDVGDVLTEPVDFEPTGERIEAAIERARATAPDALPVVLGGEHTVSLAAVRALRPASIVSLDAHPDLWEHQNGRQLAQGTWLRRAIEQTDCEVSLPLARAARGGEQTAIDALGIQTTMPSSLPEPVYLTVDVDVFDPQDAPGVVYPEAEGPSVEEVLDLVARVASDHELVGIDVVEVNASHLGPTAELGAHVLSTALAGRERGREQ